MPRIFRSARVAALAAAGIMFMVASASAAELLMFEASGCPWCRRWHAEVGVAYPKTKEGQRAPLRLVKLSNEDRSGVTLSAPVRMSPTFVLVNDGREVGRITGYPGADFFWGMLAELIAKLDKGAAQRGPARSMVLQRQRSFAGCHGLANTCRPA